MFLVHFMTNVVISKNIFSQISFSTVKLELLNMES